MQRCSAISFRRSTGETTTALLGDDCEFIDVAAGEKSHGIEQILVEFQKWEGGFPIWRSRR